MANGGRDDPSREELGKLVRSVWIEWAKDQHNAKKSWLLGWEELSEPDKEVDRMIGERLYELGTKKYQGYYDAYYK